jgi:FdhD protein
VKRGEIALSQVAGAVEEPLEIRLVYGAADGRKVKSISINMRTPGNDDELARPRAKVLLELPGMV